MTIQQKQELAVQSMVEHYREEIAQPIVEEIGEIYAMLIHILDTHKLWAEDGTYTSLSGVTLYYDEVHDGKT